MNTYVVLLRGVNVSGHNRIKMNDLQHSLESLGCKEIRTYLQSGNAVLKAPKQELVAFARKISEMLLGEHGIDVPVVVRTALELAKAAAANPFLKEKGIDLMTLHMMFLSDPPKKEALSRLSQLEAGKDRWRCAGAHLYLHCPDGYGDTKLSNTRIEKALDVKATTRNWKTVRELNRIAGD